MGELKFTKEEQRAIQKYKIKEANGIATPEDDEEFVLAVIGAMLREAENEESRKETEELEKDWTLENLYKYEDVEGLLQHCIIEYVGQDYAREDPIGIPLKKAAEVDAIFMLLNLSDFGIEKAERQLEILDKSVILLGDRKQD